MGHYGKHIIDPETGLCEICDKGAIYQVRHGKRPEKHVYYTNHDEMPHPKDRYVYEIDDEPTPRYVRKSIYPTPAARPRRIVYEQPMEEPIVIRRKVIRRDHVLPEDDVIHRPHPRSKAFYYVDREGQMLPRESSPPPEPPRQYVVQSKPIPPAHTVRVVRRHAGTPPPPASQIWHSGPRRQINSDTEIIERQQRRRREDSFASPPPPLKLPEMYYIEAVSDHRRRSPPSSPFYMPSDNHRSSPRMVHQRDGNRQQQQHPRERIEPTNRTDPEPTVVRRVYKKLPPGKYEPPEDNHVSRELPPPSGRKVDTLRPPVRQYESSPQLHNGNTRGSEHANDPSVYYIRPVDQY